MRGLGQIAELCAIARPTAALVTSIGPEHLELVGTVEDVARANAEALEALPPGGIAVVPADEPLLEPYLRQDLDVRRFDRSGVTREDGAVAVRRRPGRTRVAAASCRSPAPPRRERPRRAHDVRRARAFRSSARTRARLRSSSAAGVGRCASCPAAASSSTTRTTRTPPRCAPRSSTSPSARAAGVVWPILGEMAELGDASARYHDEIRALLGELGIEVVVARRRGRPRLPRRRLTSSSSSRTPRRSTRSPALLRPGDAILVKASRAVGLEGIPALIEKHSRAW